MLALYVSGVASLHRYTSIVDPIRFLGGFHGLAAGAATVLVAGHVYLAVLHPATRHALRGITLGTVRRDWAEDHHADWVASLDARSRGWRAQRALNERRDYTQSDGAWRARSEGLERRGRGATGVDAAGRRLGLEHAEQREHRPRADEACP